MIKLMICDDEVFIRNALVVNYAWKKYGIEVESVVANGMEGYKSFCTKPVDIIITDIKMPIMSGIEMSRKIREIDKRVKIIFLSSYDEFEYAKSAIEIGVCGFVLKPISEDELDKTIRRAVVELNEKDNKNHTVEQPDKQEEYNVQSQVINAINQYIESNINKRLSLKEVAEFFQYTPNYLGQIYYKHMGMHFNDFVIKCKMEKAGKLLRVPYNQVNEVAKTLGYEHTTQFIRHFRAYWGITPSMYRNNANNNNKK